jgi:hypothetical protein
MKKYLLVVAVIVAIHKPFFPGYVPHAIPITPPGYSPSLNNVRFCTQAIIPIPGKPGLYWTDGCKTKVIGFNQ